MSKLDLVDELEMRVRGSRVSRRDIMRRAAALGLSAPAIAVLLDLQERRALAQDATPGSTPAGDEAPTTTLTLWREMTPEEGAEQVDTSGYAKNGDVTIGFSDWSLVNSWRVQARRSAEIVARNLGVEIRVTDANGDPNKQIADVEDLLAQGIDALVISPGSSESLGPTIERAYDTGIPVIAWSTGPGTDRVTSEVRADDVFFGFAGMDQLAKDMGGRGNLIGLRGVAGVDVEGFRWEGMQQALANYPDIQLVGSDYGDWALDKGKTVAENLLAAHPQIDGVWSSGAAMTRGAIQAFQEADRTLPPMSGEHLNGFLKEWQSLGLQSVAPVYPSWQAPEAVKLAVLALRGGSIHRSYLLTPAPISNDELASAVKTDASDDYWVEGYLTDAEIDEIFSS